MTEDPSSSEALITMTPGWARIWTGATLLALGALALLGSTSGSHTGDDATTPLLVIAAALGFFGLVHVAIGCVMQGVHLHESTRSADRAA